MESRFQHFILVFLASMALPVCADNARLDLDSEVFELGASSGVLAIQDFNSEWSFGFDATFHASEDFFLQLNYLEAEASLSSFENSQGRYFSGSDRVFSHYNLLLGYNLFQGEFYPSEGNSTLSTFYGVAGVGNISFGGEESFSSVIGLGYKLGLSRRFNLRVDFRDYIYESNLIVDNATAHNTHFTLGFGFLL